MRERVLILGAGIQGISCALALSAKGYGVTLIDQEPEPFGGTSFRNEGKIHLGFVYANDPSFQTAALMLEGALHFGPLLDQWIGDPIDWQALRSSHFTYAIHGQSMVSEENLLQHYEQLQNAYEAYADPDLHYVGCRPGQLWQPAQPVSPWLNESLIQLQVPTEEVAISLSKLRLRLVQALHQRGVQFLGNREVVSVERTSFGFRVRGTGPEAPEWSVEGGMVVNCLWSNRLAIDNSMGIQPPRPWVYRLKFRMLGQLPSHLAGLRAHTFALGPFGDVVTYRDAPTYISWYPACMRGWSNALQPPAEWADFCRQEQQLVQHPWVQQALTELDELIPGIGQFRIEHLSAGVIFSWGETDIDQSDSQLHERAQIGVDAHDGYFSINTGKLTTAPLFAQRLQQLV